MTEMYKINPGIEKVDRGAFLSSSHNNRARSHLFELNAESQDGQEAILFHMVHG